MMHCSSLHELNAHFSAAVAAFAAEVDAMAEYAVARWAASAAARDDRPATSARSLCGTGKDRHTTSARCAEMGSTERVCMAAVFGWQQISRADTHNQHSPQTPSLHNTTKTYVRHQLLRAASMLRLATGRGLLRYTATGRGSATLYGCQRNIMPV